MMHFRRREIVKKLFVILLAVTMAVLCLAACDTDMDPAQKEIAGKTYVYEKEGLGGEFTITLKEDNYYLMHLLGTNT